MGQTKRKLRQQRRLMRINRHEQATEVYNLLVGIHQPVRPKLCRICGDLDNHKRRCQFAGYFEEKIAKLLDELANSVEIWKARHETEYHMRALIMRQRRALQFSMKGFRKQRPEKWRHQMFQHRMREMLKDIANGQEE